MLVKPCDNHSFLFFHYSNMDARFGSTTQFVQNGIPKNDHIQRVDKLSRHISKMQQYRYPRSNGGCYDHIMTSNTNGHHHQQYLLNDTKSSHYVDWQQQFHQDNKYH
ncbi:hypothetical protein BDA99DRAFT_494262 [Phascolomyces articulosus]|uniref:Uncharacterized protein n=1 Tax=Phascolomyces articulosus TaxID=60185 RepID=A0AAD5PL62_9FUNG|nr:hypothetical protein BDA99DRAFT_494262 [Phascolomyces articulosus]